MSSLMAPVTHEAPTRSHRSVPGVIVTVKSFFGALDVGSLNTLSSTPTLLSAIVGLRYSGPIRTRTFAGSGPPSDGWAADGIACRHIAAAHATMNSFDHREVRLKADTTRGL